MIPETAFTVGPRASGGPPGYGASLRLYPSRTAVLVVDMQRFFVEAAPFAGMRRIVQPIARLLDAARAAGVTVAHLKTVFRPDMTNAGRSGCRTRLMMDSSGYGLFSDAPTAEIAPDLAPAPSDIVVVKTRFSGFAGTDLHEKLQQRGIQSLVCVGGTTTVCVESTLREALFLEYDAVILSDCTADLDEALHESALARIDMFFGWVSSSEALLPWLAGFSAAATQASADRPRASLASRCRRKS